MKQLTTNKGVICLVDDVYFDKLIQYKWHLGNKGYFYVGYSFANRKIPLHQFIYWLEYGDIPKLYYEAIDHIDRNKLNNQISNLRLVSNAVNQRNSPVKDKQSIYKLPKYITYNKKQGRYLVKHHIAGYVGYYDNIQDATIARDTELRAKFIALGFEWHV